MSEVSMNRYHKCCALCAYWNGSIGSMTIRIAPGGMLFKFDNNETHSCFKPNRGMQTKALFTCKYFKARYDD